MDFLGTSMAQSEGPEQACGWHIVTATLWQSWHESWGTLKLIQSVSMAQIAPIASCNRANSHQ
ncbi:MAG: hypothetical protein EBU26_09740 [Verrucomicrobia bacterium]|nr:hypothetical protein [Verrucomicrobiota bacterium]